MGTKMKGLLKGLRYISQIFDDEKESDMEIGFPTDVKHVAHIGWDGPAVDTPSWMKEFSAPQGQGFSAPLNINGEPKENPEVKWVSEDSNRKSNRAKNSGSAKDSPEVPKSSRRQSSADGSMTSDSPTKESSTRSRHSRRSKDSSDGSKSGSGIESLSGGLPDIPKKSRRKKSKESVGGGSSRSSRSKATANANGTYTSPFSSDSTGPDSGTITMASGELSQNSSLKPLVEDRENGHNGIS